MHLICPGEGAGEFDDAHELGGGSGAGCRPRTGEARGGRGVGKRRGREAAAVASPVAHRAGRGGGGDASCAVPVAASVVRVFCAWCVVGEGESASDADGWGMRTCGRDRSHSNQSNDRTIPDFTPRNLCAHAKHHFYYYTEE